MMRKIVNTIIFCTVFFVGVLLGEHWQIDRSRFLLNHFSDSSREAIRIITELELSLNHCMKIDAYKKQLEAKGVKI